MTRTSNRDNTQSTYREKILEHLLVGDILRHLWSERRRAEVMKPEVDAAGYDIVIECDSTLRHVQLKSSRAGAKTARQKVHLQLAEKPSGCVIWMIFEPESLAFESFLWFGGKPGEPLPDIRQLPVAKHSKGDSTGWKAERPNLRVAPKSKFDVVRSVPELVARLFG
ncbi:MAG: hypothetical protein ACYTBZ_07375 [Planctomycetota bacterium]